MSMRCPDTVLPVQAKETWAEASKGEPSRKWVPWQENCPGQG